MATIHVPQLNKKFKADEELSLMENLTRHDIPVASSCGGDGICGKCIMTVSAKALPPMSELEEKTLQKIQPNHGCRLSCQLTISSDITVQSTYW